ncbi:phospholipase A [Sphingomonas solaris]|uniref:Phospholipase A1 n=1 Tax=Alterirhizorhabdus solaris TaxID=2529389 RepID=A0A558QTS6_9SPHN|nr:phospholipase A [Sphingomonas solaris]TVV70543.1 phospholipase [Sphingomonas solaris]
MTNGFRATARLAWLGSLTAACLSMPAMAAVQPVLSGIDGAPRNGETVTVRLTLLNDGAIPERADPPRQIAATLSAGARTWPVALSLVAPPAATPIPAGGFVQLGYALRLPADLSTDQPLTLSAPSLGATALAFAGPVAADAPVQVATAAPVAARPAFESADPDTGNAYATRLSVYDPIYAVTGFGTNTDARIQVSFKYRLFSPAKGSDGQGLPGLEGLHFAYTQRLFWDLGAKSTPFRNVDYMPELFYLVPANKVGGNLWLGGQAGIRHESNGRDGLESRSLNMLYVQPVASFDLGRYRLSVGPRVWAYFGSLEDNPDIRRYRGNTGLFAEIGEDDGLRLTTNTRFNPGSGKGSITADVSYPLEALGVERLGLYVFGSGFAGYGENLLDYRRRTTRLRVGVGLTR